MGIFFMELISVGNEDTKYLVNRFVLQGLGDFTWKVFDCQELVETVSGN